jgi:chlorophyllide a reductase subunit Z
MGYAGATYIIQEYCNALFDALFNILPLGTDLDRVDPTLSRLPRAALRPWSAEARKLLEAHLETEPFLIRISAAKRLRERIERAAADAGDAEISAACVTDLLETIRESQTP